MKILRVFVRRTNYTPIDEYTRIGMPDLFLPAGIDEVHISTVFSWDIEEAEQLKENYQAILPDVKVKCGGPAYFAMPGEFVSGRYTKPGITITSRGCNFKCPWCLVPSTEGSFRELKGLEPGNVIQDNNILLSKKSRLEKVFQMLRKQNKIRFTGGIDKRLLKDWHVEEFKGLSIAEIWISFDNWDLEKYFIKAVERLKKAGFRRNQIRCYVLAGFNEPVKESEDRLKFVFECGALPFVQLYQEYSLRKRMAGEVQREDNLYIRNWSRPAIIKSISMI